LQNRHFKTDDTGDSGARDGSGSRNRERKERKPKEKKPSDEDADIARAIEESKKTAEREERNRLAAAKRAGAEDVIGKRKKPAEAGGDDFDFGGKGLDDKPSDPNDINDFDFGGAGAKEEKKEPASDEFDFNFAGGEAKGKPSEEPAAQTGDLLDLLGGLDMNAGTVPAQPEGGGQNALDFFNDDSAKNDGALGAAAAGGQ